MAIERNMSRNSDLYIAPAANSFNRKIRDFFNSYSPSNSQPPSGIVRIRRPLIASKISGSRNSEPGVYHYLS